MRHLWRMCFALFIAAGSFFSIRERVANASRALHYTFLCGRSPILLIFMAIFYWLWRVRVRHLLPQAGAATLLRHCCDETL